MEKAGSIVYTIGSVNFLSDKSFEPYMRLAKAHAAKRWAQQKRRK
jgi:Domain of unknown function (DUF6398)